MALLMGNEFEMLDYGQAFEFLSASGCLELNCSFTAEVAASSDSSRQSSLLQGSIEA
jgi:hypothetical protein